MIMDYGLTKKRQILSRKKASSIMGNNDGTLKQPIKWTSSQYYRRVYSTRVIATLIVTCAEAT